MPSAEAWVVLVRLTRFLCQPLPLQLRFGFSGGRDSPLVRCGDASISMKPLGLLECVFCVCCGASISMLFSDELTVSCVSYLMAGPLVFDRELAADRAVLDRNDRDDPYPQPAPRHHAVQPSAHGRGEGRGPRRNRLEGAFGIGYGSNERYGTTFSVKVWYNNELRGILARY